ncbi:hypothetical protein AA0117_g11246 [Alternaria alternata]|uniref:NAD(P)-binding protein n=1 Tax=Alternaria alternata TaxID=5599 RepID=A0A4Q4N1X3_ALTAL|nr:hypothetical protein AA0117_g11246 [Alternaria alternata]
MAQKTLLFLGAGPNVGAATLSLFKTKGYKTAAVARTIKPDIEANADICLTADFSDPSVMGQIFEKVEQKLGVPNVVVYNQLPFAHILVSRTYVELAYSWSMGPDPENPVSAPLQDFQKDLAINSVSAYAAAQAAVAGFSKLPKDVKKTFIYTGNNGNTLVTPMFLMLGIGKTSAWYMIQTLAASSSLASKGCRFYYVDERTPVGKAMFHVSGPAHAEYFMELAEKEGQSETLATFVRGKGYMKFPSNERAILPHVSVQDAADPKYGAPGTAEAKYGY